MVSTSTIAAVAAIANSRAGSGSMLHLLRFVSAYYTEFAGSCRKDVRMTPRRDHLAMLLPVSRTYMAEVTWEEFAAHYGETPNPGLDTPTSPTRQRHAEHHVPGQTSVAQRVSG